MKGTQAGTIQYAPPPPDPFQHVHTEPPPDPARATRAVARWELVLLLLVPLLAPGPRTARRIALDARCIRRGRACGVASAWRAERDAHEPCRRFHPQGGGMETLEPEHVWDGWEWVANPAAPSAEELAGPHIRRPFSHPAEVAKREAARAREAEEREWWGDAREHDYERAALAVFLEEARGGDSALAAYVAARCGGKADEFDDDSEDGGLDGADGVGGGASRAASHTESCGEAAHAGVGGGAVDARGRTDLESAAKDLQGGLDYVFEAVAADGCSSHGNVAAAVKGGD